MAQIPAFAEQRPEMRYITHPQTFAALIVVVRKPLLERYRKIRHPECLSASSIPGAHTDRKKINFFLCLTKCFIYYPHVRSDETASVSGLRA